MTKPRQYHYGGVPRTSLQSTINDTDELGLIIAIGAAEATNWPTIGPFVVRLERGTPREEAFLCSGRSGTNLMVTERGYDETPRVAHTAGSAVFVEHTFDGAWPNAIDAILAMPTAAGDLVVTNGTEYILVPAGSIGQVLRADPAQPARMRWGISPVQDLVMAAGDLLYGAGVDTLARLPIGTAGMPLVSLAGLPAWSTMSGAYITDDTIEGSKISSGTIGTDHLIDRSVTQIKLALGAVGPGELAPGAVGPAALADPQRVSVYADPGVSISTTWTAITSAWTEAADPDNMHNAGIFTAPVAGVYAFILWGQGSFTTEYIQFRLAHNGLTARMHSPLIQIPEMSWEPVMYMGAGETVRLETRCGPTGTAGFYLDAMFVLVQAF